MVLWLPMWNFLVIGIKMDRFFFKSSCFVSGIFFFTFLSYFSLLSPTKKSKRGDSNLFPKRRSLQVLVKSLERQISEAFLGSPPGRGVPEETPESLKTQDRRLENRKREIKLMAQTKNQSQGQIWVARPWIQQQFLIKYLKWMTFFYKPIPWVCHPMKPQFLYLQNGQIKVPNIQSYLKH